MVWALKLSASDEKKLSNLSDPETSRICGHSGQDHSSLLPRTTITLALNLYGYSDKFIICELLTKDTEGYLHGGIVLPRDVIYWCCQYDRTLLLLRAPM